MCQLLYGPKPGCHLGLDTRCPLDVSIQYSGQYRVGRTDSPQKNYPGEWLIPQITPAQGKAEGTDNQRVSSAQYSYNTFRFCSTALAECWCDTSSPNVTSRASLRQPDGKSFGNIQDIVRMHGHLR
jgi:hypothetical protein